MDHGVAHRAEQKVPETAVTARADDDQRVAAAQGREDVARHPDGHLGPDLEVRMPVACRGDRPRVDAVGELTCPLGDVRIAAGTSHGDPRVQGRRAPRGRHGQRGADTGGEVRGVGQGGVRRRRPVDTDEHRVVRARKDVLLAGDDGHRTAGVRGDGEGHRPQHGTGHLAVTTGPHHHEVGGPGQLDEHARSALGAGQLADLEVRHRPPGLRRAAACRLGQAAGRVSAQPRGLAAGGADESGEVDRARDGQRHAPARRFRGRPAHRVRGRRRPVVPDDDTVGLQQFVQFLGSVHVASSFGRLPGTEAAPGRFRVRRGHLGAQGRPLVVTGTNDPAGRPATGTRWILSRR
jgi:hypothetical protein